MTKQKARIRAIASASASKFNGMVSLPISNPAGKVYDCKAFNRAPQAQVELMKVKPGEEIGLIGHWEMNRRTNQPTFVADACERDRAAPSVVTTGADHIDASTCDVGDLCWRHGDELAESIDTLWSCRYEPCPRCSERMGKDFNAVIPMYWCACQARRNR